jgi:hypothetical protein
MLMIVITFSNIFTIPSCNKENVCLNGLCGYKGKIESTKHSGGNSNIPEKVERTH